MTERRPLQPWTIVGLTVVVVAFILAATLLAFVAGRVDQAVDVTPERPFEKVGPVAIETIRDLATLTTVEMVSYTTVEKGTDRGWLNWATGDAISMFAVAEIGAGVDLTGVTDGDVDQDTETASIVIRLPAPEITYIAVDNEATHVYDRSTGVFTRGDPNLERAARLAAEEILVAEVLEQGILDEARASAVTVLTDFLKALGYESVTILVGN